jgi:putative transposase
MSKWPRIVVPGFPHHITQRGTRRQTVFFGEDDFKYYRHLLATYCCQYGVEIWAYCLMPNHVHLIAVPETEQSLSKAFGRAHQRYAQFINGRHDWRGHLWEQRFSSIPMDENHLFMAARYVELNPVRANMVRLPSQYLWSSANAHLKACDDDLVLTDRLLNMVPQWSEFLAEGLADCHLEKLRELEKTGYPAGDDNFVKLIENEYGVSCRPKKRGPKSKVNFRLS